MHTAEMVHAFVIDAYNCPGIAVGSHIMESVLLNTLIETGVAARAEPGV